MDLYFFSFKNPFQTVTEEERVDENGNVIKIKKTEKVLADGTVKKYFYKKIFFRELLKRKQWTRMETSSR